MTAAVAFDQAAFNQALSTALAAAIIPSPTGPGVPIINGVGDMSVDEFLKDPLRIQKAFETALPANFFLTDVFFTDGGVSVTGVVEYNQVTNTDLYIDVDANRQPQTIEPGMEFPDVSVYDLANLIGVIQKMGGKFKVTKEQADADRRDVVQIGLRKLGNTLLQLNALKAINAMVNDATVAANCTVPASGVWTGSGSNDPFIDIDLNVNALDNGNDLGYDSNVGVIHPDAAPIIKTWARKNNQLPRENTAASPIFRKDLVGIGGLDWIVSRRCPRTTMIIAARGQVGSIVRRRDPFTNVVPEPLTESQYVLAGRAEQPFVTDPYAVRVVTGIIS